MTADGDGVYGPAALAIVLGGLHLVLGVADLAGGEPSLAATLVALNQVVLGGLLLPTAVGLARGRPWSRFLGVVCFSGLALVQLLPLVSGASPAVPLLGILVGSTAALYLVLAPGAFSPNDGRDVDEDTDPHDFVR
jgi:hypothetical protein